MEIPGFVFINVNSTNGQMEENTEMSKRRGTFTVTGAL